MAEEKIFHDIPESQRIDLAYHAEQTGLKQLAETTGVSFDNLSYLANFRKVPEYQEGVAKTVRDIRKQVGRKKLREILTVLDKLEEHSESYL